MHIYIYIYIYTYIYIYIYICTHLNVQLCSEAMLSYLMAHATDPGRVPKGWQEPPLRRSKMRVLRRWRGSSTMEGFFDEGEALRGWRGFFEDGALRRGGGWFSEDGAGFFFLPAPTPRIINQSGERKRGDEKRGDRTSKQKYTTNKHKQT